MAGNENNQKQGSTDEDTQNRKTQQDLYLGILTKQQLIIICVTAGLVLVITAAVTALVIISNSGFSIHLQPFPTGGDMLDFLVQSGEINKTDGLLATWFHRANSKEDMTKALASDSMILEADVTLEGYGTANEKPVPIMAHPPLIYSDNTLDQWLDAVLDSRKGIKLDFKSLASVGLSLELLRQKNSKKGLNRPVWLNADILRGPNMPEFLPPVNGTRFLQLIQEKFPDVTLSPGWKVAYAPPLFVNTYTRQMVEEMYDTIKDAPQKVTFPVHALLVRRGWQHLSWLLSQSPRFSLTLWQGSIHPNVSDLMFIRDNTHPAQVYYDIYEPTLSEFKAAAGLQGHVRRFYPGGDPMNFLYPPHNSETVTQPDSLGVQWFTVTAKPALSALISEGAVGMLALRLGSDSEQPGVPVVEGSGGSSGALTLQDVLQLLGQRAEVSLGVYLRLQGQQLLEASLQLLHSAYSHETLYRPVWIHVEGTQPTDSDTHEFVSAVERVFPDVTLVLTQLNWPPEIPAAVAGLSHRVALHLSAGALPKTQEELQPLAAMLDRCDIIVEDDTKNSTEVVSHLKMLVMHWEKRANTNLYLISNQP